ncbi:MAG: PilZ domain-containing protein [Acidobacteriota bacterium]|nr:MAG: PilZ domain-containing protein [Acidobacteriota bacterium]
MDFLKEILDKPFLQLQLEQQALVVVVVLACLVLVGYSTTAAIRHIARRRVETRVAVFSPITISWQDSAGTAHEVRGHCLDLSAGGLRMELRDPIEPGTSIKFEVLTRNLRGEASVRHCTAVGAKYEIGVQFLNTSQ